MREDRSVSTENHKSFLEIFSNLRPLEKKGSISRKEVSAEGKGFGRKVEALAEG